MEGVKLVNSIARHQLEDTSLSANPIQFSMRSISVSRNSSMDKKKLKHLLSLSNEIKTVLNERYERNEEGCLDKNEQGSFEQEYILN